MGSGAALNTFTLNNTLGTLQVGGGAINTVGDQIYNGPVVLTNAAALTTTNGAVTFNGSSTIDGAFDLAVTTAGAGAVTFNAAVGTTPLTNLTVNASAQIKLNADVTVAGGGLVKLIPFTTGGVLQTAGVLTASMLQIGAVAPGAGAVALPDNNQIGLLAINETGIISVHNAIAIAIDVAGALSGIQSHGGTVTITTGTLATPLGIALNQNIDSTPGGGGLIYQDATVTGAGTITAGGNVTLNDDNTQPIPVITAGQPDPTNVNPPVFHVAFVNGRGQPVPVSGFTGPTLLNVVHTQTGTNPFNVGSYTINTITTPGVAVGSAYNVSVPVIGDPTQGTIKLSIPVSIATDAAGKTSVASSFTINYDSVSLHVLSIGIVTNLTNGFSVDFTVNCDKPMLAATATDFQLLVGSIGSSTQLNASIQTVTVSGNSYTVTVTTDGGDGTLNLNVLTSIKDVSNNHLLTQFNGLPASLVTVVHTLPRILSISSATADGVYNAGAVIDVTVTFSRPVTLAGGSLNIALDTNQTLTLPAFASQSVISTTYTVAPGDSSASDPGDFLRVGASALTLSGGTLKDFAANSAVLLVPSNANFFANQIQINADPVQTSAMTVAFDPNFATDQIPNVGLPGQTLTFTAGVTDVDLNPPFPVASNVLRFNWDFGDGTTALTTGATNFITHVYACDARKITPQR